MSDCPFCEIVDGRAPAHRILEDDRSLAFLDVEPATRGHALVVPRTHCETLTDMDASLVSSVFRTARRIAAGVEAAFDPDGVNLLQSNGVAAGQEVPHAHVHVVPRYENDDVTVHWPTSDATNATEAIAEALRREL